MIKVNFNNFQMERKFSNEEMALYIKNIRMLGKRIPAFIGNRKTLIPPKKSSYKYFWKKIVQVEEIDFPDFSNIEELFNILVGFNPKFSYDVQGKFSEIVEIKGSILNSEIEYHLISLSFNILVYLINEYLKLPDILFQIDFICLSNQDGNTFSVFKHSEEKNINVLSMNADSYRKLNKFLIEGNYRKYWELIKEIFTDTYISQFNSEKYTLKYINIINKQFQNNIKIKKEIISLLSKKEISDENLKSLYDILVHSISCNNF